MCDFLERRARGGALRGVKTQRLYCRVLAALFVSSAGLAIAQGQPATPAGPVALQVDATGMALDEGALREAIIRELSLEAAPTGTPRLAVALRVVSGGELTVTLVDDAGRDQSRSVAAPARAEEVPEVTALLVGNLARDEASGLLARLRQPEPLPEAEPSAGAAGEPPALEPQPALPLESVNLSLFHPVTLRQHADERRFAFELGLFYSRIGALSGVAIEAAGVGTVVGDASGVMIAGLGYTHGGRGEGVLIGGLFGVGTGDLAGASIAGAVAIEHGSVDGAQLAGAFNMAGGALEGTQIAGMVNLAGSVQGAQTAGLFNMSRALDGVQISGIVNLAERIQGLQLSLINVGGDVDGVQLGLLNVARDVDGVQLGLVNVAREVDGVSLGIVPYSQRGRTQFVSWYDTTQPFNVGVRFHTGALYVMPTFGYDPRGNEEIVANVDGSYAPGFSLGYRLGIGRAFADLDVNSSNPSTGSDYGENDIDLRYRVLGGYQLSSAFGVFLGGGVRHRFNTQGQADPTVKPELSVGIQVL